MYKGFTIVGVHIDFDYADVTKNLVSGIYQFNHCAHIYPPNYGDDVIFNKTSKLIVINDIECRKMSYLYGPNVAVSAIVGKNGSGKSGIIEIIYRIINNLAKKFLPEASRLRLCPLVNAAIYFLMDGKAGIIVNNNEDTYIVIDDEEITDPTIISRIFYSIGINYSMYAFRSLDYQEDQLFIASTPTRLHALVPTSNEEDIWIDGLFHKVDNYEIPITLIPHREHGHININELTDLNTQRISSILIWEYVHSKDGFIDGYVLDRIEYKFNYNTVYRHYDNAFKDNDEYRKNQYAIRWFVNNVLLTSDHETIGHAILESYGVLNIDSIFDRKTMQHKHYSISEDPYLLACMYLVYKTLSVTNKLFNNDNDYLISRYGDLSKCLLPVSSKDDIEFITTHVMNEFSYITLKIHQTVNYLYVNKDFGWNKNNFSLDQFIDIAKIDTYSSLERLIRNIPPPFFQPNILLLPKNENTKVKSKKDKSIPYKRLSSGEKQVAILFSDIVYHLQNLKIQDIDAKSRNINIVIDEIETNFHPEYQRKLVSKILKLLQDLHFTRIGTDEGPVFNINLLLVTHSPFILSDIPSSNTLYLENGEVALIPHETFAANVVDLLKNSFFLDNGLMGEFSKKMILDFIDNELDNPEILLELIGDSVLKRMLKAHVRKTNI